MTTSPSTRFEELPPSPTASTSSFHSTDEPPAFPALSQATPAPVDPDRDLSGAELDDSDHENEDSVWWTPSELRDILERSTALKVKGNLEFGRGQWEDALATYREGLVELPVRTQPASTSKGKEKAVEAAADTPKDDEDILKGLDKLTVDNGDDDEVSAEEVELRELRSILFANVAACCLQLKRYKDACAACDDALEDNPTYVKALHRRALASEQIGSWSSLSSSLEDYNTIAGLPTASPSLVATAKQAQKQLPKLVAEQQAKEQAEVMGKLKDLGNSVLGKFGLSTDNFKFVEQPGGGYSMNFER